jgi:hypothetical protein
MLGEGLFRLATFDSEDRALADLRRREENVRRRLNPFRCGNELADLTSYPESVFLDWVQDAGLTPPAAKKGKRDWASWWEDEAPGAAQRLKVWQAIDRVRFYSIVERPAVAVGYVLLTPVWQYNDEYHFLNSEGGTVQAVYRTRARAEEEARRLAEGERGRRGHWFPVGVDAFDPETHWHLFESGCLYDIIEVELEGLS